MLTAHPYMHSFEGPNLNNNREPIAFRVDGLPVGQEAWIAWMKGNWRILHATRRGQGDWVGEYGSPNEALATLETAAIVQINCSK
jgi:hypothetical protein